MHATVIHLLKSFLSVAKRQALLTHSEIPDDPDAFLVGPLIFNHVNAYGQADFYNILFIYRRLYHAWDP